MRKLRCLSITLVLLIVVAVSCTKEGPEGPMGATGPQGRPGNTGASGTAGTAGATGAQGPPGTANVIYSGWLPSPTGFGAAGWLDTTLSPMGLVSSSNKLQTCRGPHNRYDQKPDKHNFVWLVGRTLFQVYHCTGHHRWWTYVQWSRRRLYN
jgi:hypothetical protein